MLFTLDGSGSMGQNNKWTAATGAITAIFGDMQTKADPGLGVGLNVFSDSNDPTGGIGPYPSGADIPIAFVDATQDGKLKSRVSGQPSGGTPTGSAMGIPSGGGYGELASYTPSAPLLPGGKKVLVLITDGVPTDTCSTNGDGSDNYPANACVAGAAAQLAGANKIQTFVIGGGILPTTDFSNFDPYFLGALAQAGGTAPPGCNPKENTKGATDFCYFEVDPSGSSTATQQAFEAAINAIRGQVASCTFPLQATDAGTIDPGKVNVVLDGNELSQDPNNGWTYDNPSNPTEIILHGTACDTMKNSPSSSIQIVLGCATKKPV
jgi:hypothetical protein